MKQNGVAFLNRHWPPIVLLLATTWLYAPFVNGAAIGSLEFISTYEASGPWSWLFRLGDIVAATILLALIVKFKVIQRQRFFGWMLFLIALTMLIDGIFTANSCATTCTSGAVFQSNVHAIETAVSLVLVAAAAIYDAFKSNKFISRLFVGFLALCALAVFIVDANGLHFVQYIYQLVTIGWIVAVMYRFSPKQVRSNHAVNIRTALAVLVLFGGLLELTFSLDAAINQTNPLGLLVPNLMSWLAHFSVASGLIMLYIALQIYRGQRRAGILLAIVVGANIIRYALLVPHVQALLLSEVLLYLLWLSWPKFDRNVYAPAFITRLRSLLPVFIGIVLGTLFLSVSRPVQQDLRRELLWDLALALGGCLTLLLVWLLFRPSGAQSANEQPNLEEITQLLERYANSSEDYFKLWPTDKQYFMTPGIDGFVAYKQVKGAVFALADPVCAKANKRKLLKAFSDYCRQHGWPACYILVTPDSLSLYKTAGLSTIKVGSSAVIPVKQFVEKTARDKWWRWQLNRSRRQGMVYDFSQPPHDAKLLRETNKLSQDWLNRAGHTEQGFALGYYDTDYLRQCRLHLLRDESGELISFANELPVFNKGKTATVDLIRFRPDINGAMPTLIAHLIMQLSEEGVYENFDLGFVPLAKIDTRLIRVVRRLAAGRFSAAGLEQFKGKFDPTWETQYLAYDNDLVDLAVMASKLEKAMEI